MLARVAIDQLFVDPGETRKWVDSHLSDTRFFNAEKAGGIFLDFVNDSFIESARVYHSGRTIVEKLVMAAKLIPRPGNMGSGSGWHRDSPHTPQFKAMLYLEDVNDENGPFEYIPGTHKSYASVVNLLKGLERPNQYRYTGEEIEKIKNTTVQPVTFCSKVGTLIIFDAKGIHRGAPIQNGERYALTLYCGDGPSLFL